ncbi:MAG TPA: type II toxin-antitoxin system RelE/ParE family toxin [Acidobacteriaceae bacterium]
MQVYKTKGFARFVRHERITDTSLREAILRAEQGLVDADLGGGLIKQRVARKGQGRSGGYRMIVAYRMGNRAVFLYAFAKQERENIDQDELVELRKLGLNWLSATSQRIEEAIDDGELQEVDLDEDET